MKEWKWVIIIGLILAATTVAGYEIVPVDPIDPQGHPRWLSVSQIYQLASQAGFIGVDLITATAIAMAESGGDSGALGDILLGYSYGLWQINAKYHPEFGPDFSTLYNPQVNAAAAYSVYKAAGYSFSPWSTFKSGAYQAFVPQVQAIANA